MSAQTPTEAVARALRELGLTQGVDFRVRVVRQSPRPLARAERAGTVVQIADPAVDRLVAHHADAIIARTSALGWPFAITITYTRSGQPICTVHRTD